MPQGSPAGGPVKYFSLEYMWRKWKMNIVCIRNVRLLTDESSWYNLSAASRYDSK